jgi:hypothetical protein
MRSIERLLLSALLAALLLAGATGGQAPDQKEGPPRGFVRRSPISVDDIVARIMSFDKNKDGKVTRDELPERMHHLIALGDTNKDGALDRDEIKKLVTARGGTPGGFTNVGFRIGGFQVADGPGPGPGPGLRPGVIEGVVDDLKLSGKKKDRAMAAVKAHQEDVRKLMDQARGQLLQKMQEILSKEELEDFKAALDRLRGGIISLAAPDGPRPGDLERKIDQLQKELNELRQALRR